ncbi:MAG: diacylglycerol kinase family lipid kinase [Polyangiaceae bacterium]|nr:diacylglycerol kinase family lipid kinase [Polyangiaceae bacterium]
MKVEIIANPVAGSGKGARLARSLRTALAHAKLHETSIAQNAESLARERTKNGAETLIVVGGDGTISEAMNGILTAGQKSLPKVAILPAGTGGDFRRTFALTNDITSFVRQLNQGRTRRIDLGQLVYRDFKNRRCERFFSNVCSFGLGGLTDQLVEASPKWIGGRAAFFLGAVRATLAHQPIPIGLRLDDQELPLANFSNVAICNGRYFGGGMRIAPDASPDDGLFDVITIEGSKAQTLSLAATIYAGTHLKRPGVSHYRAKKVEAFQPQGREVLLDVDGEPLGRLDLRVSNRKRCIELIV